MSYIKTIVGEECSRLRALSRKYSDKIASLPQGTISIKKRRNRDYLYLACRRDGKVKFDYIGPAESDKARRVMEQVKTRKDYEEKFRQVKGDLKEIEKVIHGRKI
ncbi:MAG: hypothetical protein SWH68_04665 [Thermodesulfobacteriota bacterium]|nr:hypothetical protein [Thermodesulfobacteriota bacterium]